MLWTNTYPSEASFVHPHHQVLCQCFKFKNSRLWTSTWSMWSRPATRWSRVWLQRVRRTHSLRWSDGQINRIWVNSVSLNPLSSLWLSRTRGSQVCRTRCQAQWSPLTRWPCHSHLLEVIFQIRSHHRTHNTSPTSHHSCYQWWHIDPYHWSWILQFEL